VQYFPTLLLALLQIQKQSCPLDKVDLDLQDRKLPRKRKTKKEKEKEEKRKHEDNNIKATKT